ncbi:MAG: hypothetical protein U1E05_27935 [Patescibacteria group bacterium]|nr:hypothetical protein [Patescibacteria group bacterium]
MTRRWPVAIEYWRGSRVARIPLSEPTTRFAAGAVAYENRSRGPNVQPARIDGPHGLGHHMRRLLAREHDESDGESKPNTWRDWAARTLRGLRR